jgi:hypothetical protein
MTLAIAQPARGAVAAWTPLGDLEDTLSAIARGDRAGVIDATGRVVARLAAQPAAGRPARIAGVLPALAIEVARRAAGSLDAARAGVFVAMGDMRAHLAELVPAFAEQTASAQDSWARGLARLHPLWMLRYLSNAAHALVAAELGLRGDGATFTGGASVASALAAADAAIADGAIDGALVLALDDVTTDEAALELAIRHPDRVPACAIAALAVVAQAAPRASAILLDAVDGVDPVHAEPSASAIAAIRARLPPAARELASHAQVGWAGAASPLVEVLVGARQVLDGDCASARVTIAGGAGHLGVVRIGRRA